MHITPHGPNTEVNSPSFWLKTPSFAHPSAEKLSSNLKPNKKSFFKARWNSIPGMDSGSNLWLTNCVRGFLESYQKKAPKYYNPWYLLLLHQAKQQNHLVVFPQAVSWIILENTYKLFKQGRLRQHHQLTKNGHHAELHRKVREGHQIGSRVQTFSLVIIVN